LKKKLINILFFEDFFLAVLNKSSDSVAVNASVSSEAVADASGVVALASSATFKGVEIRELKLSDVLGLWHPVSTSDTGSASITAEVALNSQEVLRSLNRVTNKGDVQSEDGIKCLGSVNLNLVNNAVGESLKSVLNIENKVMEIVRVWLKGNGDGGEGLVKLALEGQSE